MQKTVVKYSIIFIFLLVYINRGIFITPYELENHGNEEINTVVEWVIQLVTGENNGIDEDGDSQSDCNSVKIISYNFFQEYAQYLDLMSLYSKDMGKNLFPNKENILQEDFYTQIDHPPQRMI
jgi:hypothetical protein